MISLEERRDMARTWLLESGIQNINNIGQSLRNSFNSWYDFDNGYTFAYSEISGYALTVLMYLKKKINNNIFLDRSKLAAEWLGDVARDKNGRYICLFSHKPNPFSYKEKYSYSFDVGMIINGFVNLYRETKIRRYLNLAIEAAGWLLIMKKKDGSISARYNLHEEKIDDSLDSWSTQSGPYHAKMAIGFLNLEEIVQNESYREMAVKLCDYSLKRQEKSGRFISHNLGGTNLHPHCYSAEGLLGAGLLLNNMDYINATKNSISWILNNMKENIVPRLFFDNVFIYNERTDVIAQTLRLGSILLAKGYLDNSYEEELDAVAKRLLDFQYLGNDHKQQGGFLFGFSSNGREVRNINSWCTMFALQALEIYNDYKEKKFNFDVRLLV